jgi:hypothetical protein
MSEMESEKSEMSSAEFVQYALRSHVAPPGGGSVKARINRAARALGWSISRTKDAWYAEPRMSIRADEMRQVEEKTGLCYGREEIRTNDELIARAETLLAGHEADFYRAFLTALRAVAGPSDRT